MEDSSGEVQKPDPKSEKLKPHERKRYQYKNFDWPTERENYKRLCRNDEMLTYEVRNNYCPSRIHLFPKSGSLYMEFLSLRYIYT